MRGAAGFSHLLAWIGLGVGVVASGCAGPATSAPPTEAHRTQGPILSTHPAFGRALPRVGERQAQHTELRMDLRVDVVDGGGESRHDEGSVTDILDVVEEITEVSNGVVTAVRVTVRRAENRRSAGVTVGAGRAALEMTGRVYVLRASHGGAPELQREDGAPVTAEERDRLPQQYNWLGREDLIAKALPKGQVVVGTEVPELVDAVGAWLAQRQRESQKTSGHVVVRAVGSDVVVFDLTLKNTTHTNRLDVASDLRGELQVELATGRSRLLRLAGPYELKGTGVTGSGTMTVVVESKAVP